MSIGAYRESAGAAGAVDHANADSRHRNNRSYGSTIGADRLHSAPEMPFVQAQSINAILFTVSLPDPVLFSNPTSSCAASLQLYHVRARGGRWPQAATEREVLHLTPSK